MSMLNFDPKGVENAAKLAVSPLQKFANWVGKVAGDKAKDEKDKMARQEHFTQSIEMHRQMRDMDVSYERRMLKMRTDAITKMQTHAKETGVATYEHQLSGIKTKGTFRAPEKNEEPSEAMKAAYAPASPAPTQTNTSTAPEAPTAPEKPVKPAKPASSKPKTSKAKGPKA